MPQPLHHRLTLQANRWVAQGLQQVRSHKELPERLGQMHPREPEIRQWRHGLKHALLIPTQECLLRKRHGQLGGAGCQRRATKCLHLRKHRGRIKEVRVVVECSRQLWIILFRGSMASAFCYENDNSLLNFWIRHLHSQMWTSPKTNNSVCLVQILDDIQSARDHSVSLMGGFPYLFSHTTFCLRSENILQVPQIMFVSTYAVHEWIGKGRFWEYYAGNFTINKLCNNRGQSWTIWRDDVVRDEDIALRGTHRPALDCCISDLLDAWPGNSL
jgi:hypothetical protein